MKRGYNDRRRNGGACTIPEGGVAMPEITMDEALERMTSAVAKMDADEQLEVYNEIFLDHPITAEEARAGSPSLAERLGQYFHSGLEIDWVVFLWGLIFTKHHDVWYNEEEDRIHYEEPEAMPAE
jgi:hypothetical protein